MSEIGRVPELEKSSLQRNLELGERTQVVKNGFITREQAGYCIGWKGIVNPKSEPQVILYNAIGPDIATPLLTTNATTIYGLDVNPPTYADTQRYLKAWDKIDNDVETLPPASTYFIGNYIDLGTYPPKEALETQMSETIKLRTERGYWDVDALMTWSIDRCLAIELRKLGLNPDEIKLNDTEGQVELEFPWAFPGEEQKSRKIKYIKGFLYDIADDPSHLNLPLLDGFYEKSAQIGSRFNRRKNDLQVIPKLLTTGGYVLIGRTPKEYIEDKHIEEINRRVLGSNFTRIDIAPEYRNMMEQRIKRENSNYGWDLYGARKN